jgi:hypothetical protein
VGLGFVFAPLTTLAMRDVPPALAGAASGFLNTNRQIGQALGMAVIGSILANRVASELPQQAARVASQVPASFRGRFVAAFQKTSQGAQDFGAGQSHGAASPSAPPHALVQHVAALSHEVYGQAFLGAARPSLAICAGVVILAAIFAVWFRGGRSAAAARREPEVAEELAS